VLLGLRWLVVMPLAAKAARYFVAGMDPLPSLGQSPASQE
jgi:hypothetical protein